MDNIIRILNHDPELAGKIAIDEFSTRGLALDSLPWNTCDLKRQWTDTDDAGIAWYLEDRYGITGRDKISGALMLVSEQQRFNDVKDYLLSVSWDGAYRLDTAFHDYLGSKDTPYIRGAARKSFTAAVARVMTPGCKYDYVPVFIGPQGIGKPHSYGQSEKAGTATACKVSTEKKRQNLYKVYGSMKSEK